jgi:two-component system LytT family response regulator
MISTPINDLRILRSIDIGFFRYNSDRKLWEVVLNNQLPLLLKKNTTADHIKGYDSCFVQIHQSYIININYLMMIKENRCVMFPPFENITELQVSKKFRKELQDRFYLL